MTRALRASSGVEEKAIDVVVVEDDEASRTMIATLLSTHACHVRAFGCADQALPGALGRIPDVVVTDLRLEGSAQGWELAEALRADERTKHVALVAVTGQVDPERAFVAPFDAYLRKPVETQLLLDLVRQLARIARTQRRAAVGR